MKSTEGRSGISPPWPSITGTQGNSFVVCASAAEKPASSSVVLAARRQAKLEPEEAVEAQEGTPATKFSQSGSLRSGVKSAEVAWEPDSRICSKQKCNGQVGGVYL